ncbi:unnamed protein product [Caenorhabditis bovis]|uniref:Aquaporin n=1 Tax=Caenorhabditis bovis TaxID=2654633 RepID=A0A8S1F0H5_9PELO|nr:unnamed protein product [Caenorhabditis bovis]
MQHLTTSSSDADFHNSLIRPNIGELIGSFLFAFLGCFAGQHPHIKEFTYPIFTALSLYISRALVLHATPAYFNPAVTIVQCVRREIPIALAISFIVVQLFAFFAAITIFRCLTDQSVVNDNLILYDLVEDMGIRRVSRLQAFLIEMALSIVFYSSFRLKKNKEAIIALSWGLIQYISFPLYGFSSNISLLFASSIISLIFSPTTTPSVILLYLNVFNALVSVVLTVSIDV